VGSSRCRPFIAETHPGESSKLFANGEEFRAFKGRIAAGHPERPDFGPAAGEAGTTVNDKANRDRPPASHVKEGRYANFFQIGHNASEFLIEFGQQEAGESVFHTRIYVCAEQARVLADLMTSTLEQHERIFGRTLRVVPGNFESE
jgi:hypothetical protein